MIVDTNVWRVKTRLNKTARTPLELTDWLRLTADQNENGSLDSSLVSHVLSKIGEDGNLSRSFLRIHFKRVRFERYWSSLKGLSADLECIIFKSNATCSFWNKADYERIKQGNPLQKFILSNELIKVEWPPWKIWKADVSSVSPSRSSVVSIQSRFDTSWFDTNWSRFETSSKLIRYT